MSRWLTRLEEFGRQAENTLICALLLGMVLLAGGQIISRNLFGTTLVWGDELLRLAVLWLALAAALAASRSDRHINVAVLDRYLKGRWLELSRLLADCFTAGVCGLLAWHSLAFVQTSREFGDLVLGQVPAWIAQSVLPVGFTLMAWRHALRALGRAWQLRPHTAPEQL